MPLGVVEFEVETQDVFDLTHSDPQNMMHWSIAGILQQVQHLFKSGWPVVVRALPFRGPWPVFETKLLPECALGDFLGSTNRLFECVAHPSFFLSKLRKQGGNKSALNNKAACGGQSCGR
jgi:hypothetical protein